MPPTKYVHNLSLEPVDITQLGERNFADVIELRILRWGDHPWLSRWVQSNHRRTEGVRFRGEGYVMTEAEIKVIHFEMEVGATSQGILLAGH